MVEKGQQQWVFSQLPNPIVFLNCFDEFSASFRVEIGILTLINLTFEKSLALLRCEWHHFQVSELVKNRIANGPACHHKRIANVCLIVGKNLNPFPAAFTFEDINFVKPIAQNEEVPPLELFLDIVFCFWKTILLKDYLDTRLNPP